MGVLEQALYEAAVPLTTSLQRIAEIVARVGSFQKVPADMTMGFSGMLFEYLKRFKEWKVPDEVRCFFFPLYH